jgi:hypothetical protein
MGQQGKGNSNTQPFQFDDATRRQAYMQMMGNGNNGGNAPYGGVIPQQQQSVNNPVDQPVTQTSYPSNTRYGIWQGSDSDPTKGLYSANLPWGLMTVNGNPTGDLGRGDILGAPGLKWDYATGQVFGGDQQLDAYRAAWQPSRGTFGIGADPITGQQPRLRDYGFDQGSGTGFGGGGFLRPGLDAEGRLPELPSGWSRSTEWNIATGPGESITKYPNWWESANDPNAIIPGGPQLHNNTQGFYFDPNWNPANNTPPATPPLSPDAFLTGQMGETLGGGGGGDGGYGTENPWGSMNDIGRRMTRASSFGGRR